jgi:hypothetical protein
MNENITPYNRHVNPEAWQKTRNNKTYLASNNVQASNAIDK